MPAFDPVLLLLLAIAALGIVSQNHSITYAMLALLLVRMTPLQQYFPWIQKHGLNLGITILFIGVMAPIASGKIALADVLRSFTHWQSLLAVAVGVLVAWLGGRGLPLMMEHPGLVPGLMVGTVIGVAFFKGVPVGPLIAAGMLAVVIGKW
ncbi:DUF441 domain-containing protein [Allofranklinella schreckenbergeri]|uniref:UPF0756 membrane protein EBQ24_08155 n=2 Tax=Comamonadaceae TaxID=80864 RepID=A0A3M6R264_9BURK|nr:MULTISPECIES: DUF441 domain-containing protein [Comamonadaceae]RRD42805.1 DUF441 domain-containing protein [Comamonadaceae bacterium OH3737_COT-264]RRD64916.1 DUF441 domain-containing protein [Comamonadaceae bacterium OH2310_COT-174]PAT34125.1 hypothetical protein CK620_10795 [Vandammella animalimorsus]PAT38180.1 hypothetical protein CK625_01325 [Vandammella animalimorsus]PAT39870.1 hypothetical protein CK623_08460 [Vandammella animalimorsus]